MEKERRKSEVGWGMGVRDRGEESEEKEKE